MSSSIILSLVVIIAAASFYFGFSYLKAINKEEKKLSAWSLIFNVSITLIMTFLGVLAALYIERNEREKNNRNTAINTLEIAHYDLDLCREKIIIISNESRKHNYNDLDSVAWHAKSRLDLFGAPFPEKAEFLLYSDVILEQTSLKFQYNLLYYLTRLKLGLSELVRDLPAETYMGAYNDVYTMLLWAEASIEQELNYLKGDISEEQRDKILDTIREGKVQLPENWRDYL